jgi:carbonic anhydrase
MFLSPPGSPAYARTVRGDDVRRKEFRQTLRGYRIDDVDEFLERVAQELDAGHHREYIDRFVTDIFDSVPGADAKSKSPGQAGRRDAPASQRRSSRSVDAERSGESPPPRRAFATPARHMAIVTCMDPRVNPLAILRLAEGDAHVIRNAGGICTTDVIRSLSISQRIGGTKDIIVLQHTDCALLKVNDESFRDEIRRDVGEAPPWEAGAFSDVGETVRHSLSCIKANVFVPSTDTVRGFVYDVFTGRLDEVSPQPHHGASNPEHDGGLLFGGWWSDRKG